MRRAMHTSLTDNSVIITDKLGMVAGARALRHVDQQRRSLLHCLDIASGGYRGRQILGSHRSQLYTG